MTRHAADVSVEGTNEACNIATQTTGMLQSPFLPPSLVRARHSNGDAVSTTARQTVTGLFSAPEAQEGILSLNKLFATRVKSMPNSTVVAFPRALASSSSAAFGFDEITYRQLDALVSQAARTYATSLSPRQVGQPLLTVGLLAESGFDYVVTELALVRLGHCVLLLSPNNSVPAIANLLQVTKATHLLYSARYASVAVESAQSVSLQVTLREWSPVRSTAIFNREPSSQSALTQAQESEETAFIVHSSGSTGFPKPIFITHKASVKNLSSSLGRDAFITVPLYHNYGHASLWRAMWSCKKLFIFPQDMPLTGPNLINALTGCRHSVQQFYAVPYVLKLLAEMTEGMELLRGFEVVSCAGSACPTDVGDRLVAAGVRLVSNYGATEVGQVMSSMRDFASDYEWNAVRMHAAFAPFAQWIPQGGGSDDAKTYELVVKPGWPAQTKSNRPDGSYATSDLFTRHPFISDAYLFVGRSDDTLVHSNGEKTNPIPMELTMRGSPFVADAMVFGAGRPQAGVLIILADNAGDDAMQSVWPSIQDANSKAPSHSRIIPELVHFLPSQTKFTSADKGSVIRAKVTATYALLIDDIYARYENGRGTEDKRKPSGLADALQMTRSLVANVLSVDEGALADNEDLFDRGIDSLASTRIVNAIKRTIDVDDRPLPSTLVFECPTIAKLARHIYGQAEEARDTATMMHSMVEKYSQLVREALPARPTSKTQSVVLTGATGSLGAHLLHVLSQRADVTRVWCLCRAATDADATERVSKSLALRKLSTLEDMRSLQVTCLAANMTKEDLGLSPSELTSVLEHTTTVIHAAYPVNFNMSVTSFSSSIQSAVHLINVCSRSRFASVFHFCSSVSAATRRATPRITETISTDPLDAQQMGYAQSKWVMEAICSKSTSAKSQPCVVHRIGQMVGDSVRGIWNETEAIPLMIKAAQTIGALPDLTSEKVSWLPVDQAASMIADVCQGGVATAPPAVHILNDVLTPYGTIYDHLRSAGLSFEVVSTAEWLQRLRTAKDQDPSTNPTIKLLDFYTQKYTGTQRADDDQRRGAKEWDMSVMRSLVEVQLGAVDADAVGKMVEQWRSSGFLV